MFTVTDGDTLPFLLWVAALVQCFCAATALLFRLGCEVRPRNLLMVLGYTIAGFLILSLPLIHQNTIRVWNIQGLLAAFSLLSLSLTEVYFFLYQARPVVRNLEKRRQWSWIVANSILLLAPILLSIILFSPIHLSHPRRLVMVYLIPILVLFRTCLGTCAYAYIASATKPSIEDEATVERANTEFTIASATKPSAEDEATVERANITIAKHYSISCNATRISIMESVLLLGCSISAKWCFSPYYVSVLGTATAGSRSYLAFVYYEANGPSSTNDANTEGAAAARNASSASPAHIQEVESVASGSSQGTQKTVKDEDAPYFMPQHNIRKQLRKYATLSQASQEGNDLEEGRRSSHQMEIPTTLEDDTSTAEESTLAVSRRAGTSPTLTDTQPGEVTNELGYITVTTSVITISERIHQYPPSPPLTPTHTDLPRAPPPTPNLPEEPVMATHEGCVSYGVDGKVWWDDSKPL